jgi:hypothetical protein
MHFPNFLATCGMLVNQLLPFKEVMLSALEFWPETGPFSS